MHPGRAQWQYRGILTFLIISALLLTARVVYLYLADGQRFPINTVKISASYQHISRDQLEAILSEPLISHSFFTFPVHEVSAKLQLLPWTEHIEIERVWPDMLMIRLIENKPIAVWNDRMLMENGHVFNPESRNEALFLPYLRGPENQQQEVLQVYRKLSKILTMHELSIATLEKSDNQAWELILTNGTRLRLGKQDLELKMIRFCKAYPAVFAGKLEQLVSVDLRYPRGMAVKWQGPTISRGGEKGSTTLSKQDSDG